MSKLTPVTLGDLIRFACKEKLNIEETEIQINMSERFARYADELTISSGYISRPKNTKDLIVLTPHLDHDDWIDQVVDP